MFHINSVFAPYAPCKETVSKRPETISGTGATQAVSVTTLKPNKAYMIANGANPAAIAFHYANNVSSGVATTDLKLAAYEKFMFTAHTDGTAQTGAAHLYVIAADGTSAFEVQLWAAGD